MKKLLITSFLSLSLLGCTPKYLVGYHYLGNNEFVAGMVSEKTESISEPFEEKCIQALIKADMESFRQLFTNKLSKAVPENDLIKLKEAIETRYKPDGRYLRLRVSDDSGREFHAELDTDVLFNGFKHYDYIEAQYLIYGVENAVVHLYLTEVGGNPILSGFEVADAYPGDNGKNFSMKYLVPETVDKAGMIGTTIIKLPQ